VVQKSDFMCVIVHRRCQKRNKLTARRARQRSAISPRSARKEHASKRKSRASLVSRIASSSFETAGRYGYSFASARIPSTARINSGCELIVWTMRDMGFPRKQISASSARTAIVSRGMRCIRSRREAF
jgi:hypothetical protein